ncbi:hypothetical protein V6N13_045788 [Hibiscus sabdariffa]
MGAQNASVAGTFSRWTNVCLEHLKRLAFQNRIRVSSSSQKHDGSVLFFSNVCSSSEPSLFSFLMAPGSRKKSRAITIVKLICVMVPTPNGAVFSVHNHGLQPAGHAALCLSGSGVVGSNPSPLLSLP